MTALQVSRFGSGQSVKRVEDDALLRGEGRFCDNMKVAGELYACFVRSPHPHARIMGIETGAAPAQAALARNLTGDERYRARYRTVSGSADFKRADGNPAAR